MRASTLLFASLVLSGCSCSDPPGALDDGGGAGADGGSRTDGAAPRVDARGGDEDAGECGTLLAVVRDFEASHSDFEAEISGQVDGLVNEQI